MVYRHSKAIGYVLNKELLINGGRFSDEYFEQLLEEIRDIRSSERKVYHKITDLYATAYDYNWAEGWINFWNSMNTIF